LGDAVHSVLKQSYRNFELILVDDASTRPETLTELQRFSEHAEVRLLTNQANLGISGATNAGIQASRGEFVAFMDHDDVIHPDALALFVRTLDREPDGDLFYTDEAVMYKQGLVFRHMRKCRVSIDLMLACNAVLHFCIVRRTVFEVTALLRSEYDGAQDHDFVLRAMEKGLHFVHIPQILYAWRIHDESTSNDIRSKPGKLRELPKAYVNGKRLIRDYLARNGIAADVTDDAFPWYRVKYALPPDPGHVAIIVPFKDKVDYLRSLLGSMKETTYENYRLYLVNNRSVEPETAEYLATLEDDERITIVPFDEPYNYSRLHNQVVRQIDNELLLFMNNDIVVTQPDWLEAMLEHIHRPKVAAVGCKLLRKDGSVQHAGTFFRPSIFSCAQNFYFEHSYYTEAQRDVSCVTAACMLIRRSAFQEVGGFDEVHFPVGFSDADLCLKIIQAGYRIIYTPFAVLQHDESASRKTQEESYEIHALFRRYIGHTPLHDPHYETMFT